MTQEEIWALEGHIPRLKAVARLDKAMAGEMSLTAANWHDLTLAATGDKELAERAYRQYVLAMLDKGLKPE